LSWESGDQSDTSLTEALLLRKERLIKYAACAVLILLLPARHVAAQVPDFDISIAGFGGLAVPFTTTLDQSGPFSFSGAKIKLETSITYGGKLSYWLNALRAQHKLPLDFGFEFDVTHFGHSIPNQRTTGSVQQAVNIRAVDMSSTILAGNLLVRWPLGISDAYPHGRWYPYLGIGAGVSRTSYGTEGVAVAPALQALGGIKVFLSQHFALFTEYKFTHARQTLEFVSSSGTTKDELNINANHFVGGLAFHFSPN
jgi:hypothetical protein